MGESKGEVSLDALLDCLPLVYNPTTKSLQLGSINHNISKFTLSNGGNPNGSIVPCESQNTLNTFANKLKSTEEISCNGESSYHSESTLPKNGYDELCDQNYTTGKDCSINGSYTDLSRSLADYGSQFALDESTTKSTIPKTKGGLSFLADLMSKKNSDCDITSEPNTTKLSDRSSSCYSWKLFSRSGKDTKSDNLQAGSAGLIMEKRPSNLPAKTSQEEENHKKQHHDIVSAFKKKEIRQAKEKKKLHCIQLRHEKQLTESVSVWKYEIIPHWAIMKTKRTTIDLWWHGIPSCVRGVVWKLAIGNDLNMSPSLFQIFAKRSEQRLKDVDGDFEWNSVSCPKKCSTSGDHETTVEFIKLDASRTFPHLGIFQQGGPMHNALQALLSAFVCYRPEVGYVQGMSFLAAMLLLNLAEEDAFVAFSNLVCRSPHIEFFSIDQISMKAYYCTFSDMLAESMPSLFAHFRGLKVTPDMYLMDWILSLFSRSLPLDTASRLWDVYLRDGQIFIFQAALGILKMYEGTLLAQECTVTCAQFLTRLREDLDPEELFKAVAALQTTVNAGWFEQRLRMNVAQLLETCRQSSNIMPLR